MSGAPEQTSPQQPYGHQSAQPAPQYAPPMAKRPGSTSTKVWGIILLLVGALLAMNWLMGLASLFGGFTGTELSPTLTDEAKAQIDTMSKQMMDEMMGRWTFWATQIVTLAVIVLSIVGGILLAFKPKPIGRNLATSRALVVLLFMPLTGYEDMKAINLVMEMQTQTMDVTLEAELKKQEKANPKMDEAEKQRRRDQAKEIADGMQPFMRGATYGIVVVMVVVSLVFNALLLFFQCLIRISPEGAARNDVLKNRPGKAGCTSIMFAAMYTPRCFALAQIRSL